MWDYILDLSFRKLIHLLSDNFGVIMNFLFSGIGITIVGALIKRFFPFRSGKSVRDLIKDVKQEGIRNSCELAKALRIDDTVKKSFSEYNDYLLIQYGSSTRTDNVTPNDYDFIVLLLGHPIDNDKEMHHVGSYPTLTEDTDSKTKVDIVFRDYTSFLFAACSGMPYENSIIVNSRLLHGHQGYYEWLKNITKNILIDRDFLLRRFEDKIIIEKELYDTEKKVHGINNYDLIRTGYYYTTSLLQRKMIANLTKVLNQDSVVHMANVLNLTDLFSSDHLKDIYKSLVDLLKRSTHTDQISSNDIDKLLSSILEEAK